MMRERMRERVIERRDSRHEGQVIESEHVVSVKQDVGPLIFLLLLHR